MTISPPERGEAEDVPDLDRLHRGHLELTALRLQPALALLLPDVLLCSGGGGQGQCGASWWGSPLPFLSIGGGQCCFCVAK